MRQTSMFIIRSCLGWLINQTNVPNEYFAYQSTWKQLKALRISANTIKSTEVTSMKFSYKRHT